MFSEIVEKNLKTMNLPGLSWYSLDEIVKRESWMNAIRDHFNVDPPEELTMDVKVDRLWAAHPELF